MLALLKPLAVEVGFTNSLVGLAESANKHACGLNKNGEFWMEQCKPENL